MFLVSAKKEQMPWPGFEPWASRLHVPAEFARSQLQPQLQSQLPPEYARSQLPAEFAQSRLPADYGRSQLPAEYARLAGLQRKEYRCPLCDIQLESTNIRAHYLHEVDKLTANLI